MSNLITELLSNTEARTDLETQVIHLESTFQPWGW